LPVCATALSKDYYFNSIIERASQTAHWATNTNNNNNKQQQQQQYQQPTTTTTTTTSTTKKKIATGREGGGRRTGAPMKKNWRPKSQTQLTCLL
jgi:hypothetical protein